jgi:predicted ATPase
LLAEGDQIEDIDLQIFGHWTTMVSHHWMGSLLKARAHNNRILALYDSQRAGKWMQLTGQDLRTVAGIWSASSTWMLGYPDKAVQISEETSTHARRLGHAFDLGFALTFGAWVFDFRCEPERLLKRVSEATYLAREQSIPIIYQVIGPMFEGFGRLRGGQVSESIGMLRQIVHIWNSFGGYLGMPYLKAALAEALARQGELDAALQTIDESLGQMERPGWQERWALAEVLRLKGWMLIHIGRGRRDEAETQLRASIEFARQQQAKSWELRSSTTLAQLLAERGQRDAARGVLAPIYNWFTEGFDTRDLREAKALLEELG